MAICGKCKKKESINTSLRSVDLRVPGMAVKFEPSPILLCQACRKRRRGAWRFAKTAIPETDAPTQKGT